MINFLLIALAAISNSAYGVVAGFYNKKKASPYKYCLAISITVLLFFLFTSGFKLDFNLKTLLWASLFGVFYFIANVCYQASIRFGGVSLTALVVSYSLVVPTLFSIIAFNERPFWTFYLGLMLLFVSLFLIGFPRKEKRQRVKPIWILLVLITLVTNGCCSLFQSYYLRTYGDEYRSEFMIIAMIIVIILMLTVIFADRKTEYDTKTSRAALGFIAGGFNALLNYLSMVLLVIISPSLLYPTTSGVALVITVIASRIFFKEKPDKLALAAIIIGITAVVFLNL